MRACWAASPAPEASGPHSQQGPWSSYGGAGDSDEERRKRRLAAIAFVVLGIAVLVVQCNPAGAGDRQAPGCREDKDSQQHEEHVQAARHLADVEVTSLQVDRRMARPPALRVLIPSSVL